MNVPQITMMMFILAMVGFSTAALPSPVHLQVEGLLEPVAVISERLPRFSFLHGISPVTTGFNITQTSYRITVSDVDGLLGTVWDSGFVKSTNCSQIEYAGNDLAPFTRYEWTAEWTTSTGITSTQATARFETGLLSAADWLGASWFMPTNNNDKTLYRAEFELPVGKTPVFARAYIAATGCSHLEVNGLVPQPDLRGICPWAISTNTVRYVTHDITSLLSSEDKFAVGLITGHVMAEGGGSPGPQLPVQAAILIMIKYDETDDPIFFSSASGGWLAGDSYVVSDSAWATTIDWTKQQQGWSSVGFQPNASWVNAITTAGDVPARALAMQLSTVLGKIKPISVEKLPDGDYLYTFPKNFVGTIELTALPSADNGSQVNILLGEWLTTGPDPATPNPAGPTRCGRVEENEQMNLGCESGQTIDQVVFASFGTPGGQCSAGFFNGTCNSVNTRAVVEEICVGKNSCLVNATTDEFGGIDPCFNVMKQLAAAVHCSGDPPGASCNNSCYDTVPGTYPAISASVQTENHVMRNGNTNPVGTLFCWHGFQFVRVSTVGNTGFKGTLDSLVGLVINTNVSQTGELSFGGEGDPESEHAAAVLDGINQMTLQSQRTNVAAYMPTDCPTREKHGWMGDALDASEQALYNFDMHAVHEAFMQLILDSQGPNGDVPVVIPTGIPAPDSCTDIAWTSVYPQLMEMLYNYYNDVRMIERFWDSLVQYQENLIRNANTGLATCDVFKDWLCGVGMSCCTGDPGVGQPDAPDCPAGQEMAGFNYVLGLRAMGHMAEILGEQAAAQRYNKYAEIGTTTFHNSFYNSDIQRYGGDPMAVQTLTVPALQIGSPPANLTDHVAQTLNDDLVNTTNYTLRVGAVTSKGLLNVLSENGLHETALRTATGTNSPSWGYWWSQGLTTCAEAFTNNFTTQIEGGTLNHIFLCGGIGEWYWKHLVGLTPTAPGFAAVSIAPKIHDQVGPKTVGGEFRSPKGLISSRWNITAKGVTLTASLPVGVQQAIIVVPKPMLNGQPISPVVVTLGGTTIWDGSQLVGNPDGVTAAKDLENGVSFSTSNGHFVFQSSVQSWIPKHIN